MCIIMVIDDESLLYVQVKIDRHSAVQCVCIDIADMSTQAIVTLSVPFRTLLRAQAM